MKADKQYGTMCFAEDTHTYWNTEHNGKYISVTTLIEKFGEDFNSDFWSKYKALEKLLPPDSWKIEKKSLLATKRFNKEILDLYDISENDFNKVQQDILDEWDKTNKEACERGSKIHSEIESSFYKNTNPGMLKKLGIGGKFECKKGYADLDLEYGVYPEYLIYRDSPDGVLHLAGQIDLLIKQGNEIILADWKTNREIKQKGGFDTQTKSTVKMKYPLNNLEECNFSHYELQLSTYAWMLQKINPDFIIKDLILVHFDHDGNQTIYHCEYRKKEVERMLTFYKKELLRELQKAKRKRIEY